jgi:hypothetical protein
MAFYEPLLASTLKKPAFATGHHEFRSYRYARMQPIRQGVPEEAIDGQRFCALSLR